MAALNASAPAMRAMEAMEGMGVSCSGQPLPPGGGTWKGEASSDL